MLLKNGADSSLKNYHNDTPVMVAKNKKVSKEMTEQDDVHNKTDCTDIPVLLGCYYLLFFYDYELLLESDSVKKPKKF